jgi:hypothetical protein
MNEEEFKAADPEFLVMISGTDETFVSKVHTRTPYCGRELRWGGRFVDIYHRPDDEEDLSIDVKRLSEIESADLALSSATA